MSPEFESAINNLPTYFEAIASNNRISIDERMYGLGAFLEEFVHEAYKRGYVVTGQTFQRLGHQEILSVHKIDKDLRFNKVEIYNFEEGGLYVKGEKAYALRSIFLGRQAATEAELISYIESILKDEGELPVIGLSDNSTFGEFMEGYYFGRSFTDIEDTEETEEFLGDMEKVVLHPELYFGIERFMRRKGILDEFEVLEPIAFFSQFSGRIAVMPDSENKYFTEYSEFNRLPQQPSLIDFKNVRYTISNQ